MTDVAFICLDLETTGLDPESDCILEIGLTLATSELDMLDSFESIVWPTRSLDDMNEFVHEMHTANGLLSDLELGGGDVPTVDVVESRVLDWLAEHELEEGTFPMMGSTIHFDRAFLRKHMPRLEAWFHYRNIDVSSLKQLVAVWSDEKWTPPKEKHHRALGDVANTLDEAAFYYATFFNRSNSNA